MEPLNIVVPPDLRARLDRLVENFSRGASVGKVSLASVCRLLLEDALNRIEPDMLAPLDRYLGE
jgi:hypothetical protein